MLRAFSRRWRSAGRAVNELLEWRPQRHLVAILDTVAQVQAVYSRRVLEVSCSVSTVSRSTSRQYVRKGAEAPSEVYRLSANCQPTIKNLVAGACNPLNLEFSWSAA
jgi:hypothetical protein